MTACFRQRHTASPDRPRGWGIPCANGAIRLGLPPLPHTACARRLAEAGATAHEIVAVTGHKTLAEVQRYTESAMREWLADQAFAKLISRQNREQTVMNLPHRFAKTYTQASENK